MFNQSYSFLNKTHKSLAMMRQAVRSILAETYRFFSQSRRDNRAAELLLLRIRARGETFGLSCVVSAICRARPLWPSAPRMGNWLPCNGGRSQGRGCCQTKLPCHFSSSLLSSQNKPYLCRHFLAYVLVFLYLYSIKQNQQSYASKTDFPRSQSIFQNI